MVGPVGPIGPAGSRGERGREGPPGKNQTQTFNLNMFAKNYIFKVLMV